MAQTQQADQRLLTLMLYLPLQHRLCEVLTSYHQDKIRELLITQNYLGFVPFIIKHVGGTGLWSLVLG